MAYAGLHGRHSVPDDHPRARAGTAARKELPRQRDPEVHHVLAVDHAYGRDLDRVDMDLPRRRGPGKYGARLLQYGAAQMDQLIGNGDAVGHHRYRI